MMSHLEEVLAAAKDMDKKAKRELVQVRNAFFDLQQRKSDDSHDGDVPPATQLLRHRSKAGLDLKLELTYLWIGGSSNPDPRTGEVHTIHSDDTSMAELMGLNKPESLGKRVIADSRRRLERVGLISVERNKGKEVVVTLLNESGNGKEYSRPGDKERGIAAHTKLPREFWTNGWHWVLDGKAVAALLVIRHLSELQGGGVWRSPNERLARHGFSDDVWYEGLRQLLEHDLLDKEKVLVKKRFEPASRHYRDTFTLKVDRMLSSPPERK